MGPLHGVKVIEITGIGPGPFCGMMLSDMGAEVIRVDRADRVRPGDQGDPPAMIIDRGRKSVGVDLKSPEGVATVLRLVADADMIFEGFRPGVAERLGIGPDECLAANPKLVYGRMTGWGQEGPMAKAAGHDINYISLAGALGAIGRKGEAPVPPLNLVGDFGGGGMYLAFGMVCALLEAQNSGNGQVVDAAMVDGAASLMGFFYGFKAMGAHRPERGTNMLDTGAHYYDVYETSDGEYVSIGSIEPQFYALLVKLLELPDDDPMVQQSHDPAEWPALKERMKGIFATRTRAEWCELMEGTDVCFAPVLSLDEATTHPHMAARGTFVEVAGITQPGPAPRFSETAAEVQGPPAHAGEHTDEVLASFGFTADEVAALRESGAVA
jgi:alpha-methylacyl-CoA racemase